MKRKLFENVSGNQFRLITESVETNPKSQMIREGLKKVFASSDGKTITYKKLEMVGMGYIKDINEAKKCAIDEAKSLAVDYGYTDVESEGVFIKG